MWKDSIQIESRGGGQGEDRRRRGGGITKRFVNDTFDAESTWSVCVYEDVFLSLCTSKCKSIYLLIYIYVSCSLSISIVVSYTVCEMKAAKHTLNWPDLCFIRVLC